ncbi:hypothetical protein GQ457_04G000230 [Hibiscus cannabinus]
MFHKWTLHHELHTDLPDSNYHHARKKSSLHTPSFASQRFTIQFSTFRDPTSTVSLPPPKQSASMKVCNALFTASNTAGTSSGCKACPEKIALRSPFSDTKEPPHPIVLPSAAVKTVNLKLSLVGRLFTL